MGHGRLLRVGALLVLVALAGACSGSGSGSAPSTTTATTGGTADTSGPGGGSAGGDGGTTTDPVSVDQLAVLDDVTILEWQPATRADELSLALSGGDPVTVQQAVDVFDLVYGGMPGATPSDLPPGQPFDSTYALALIESVRHRLAPEQVAVLDAIDASVAESAEVGGPQQIDPSGHSTTTTEATTTTVAAGFVRPTRAPNVLAKYLPLLTAAMAGWKAYRADFPAVYVTVEVMSHNTAKADMDSFPLPEDPTRCRVRIFPQLYKANPDDATISTAFAHELFHCIQFKWGEWDSVPEWVIEGSASFAAFDLYRASRPPPARYANPAWFTMASAPLAVRSYSAWALFESFRQQGGDAYAAVKAIIAAGAAGTPDALKAGAMDGVWWRTDWSSRSMRSGSFSEPEWQLAWPSPSGTEGPKDNITSGGTRGLGSYSVTGAKGFAQPQIQVTMGADVGIVAVVPVHEPMSTHAATGTVVITPLDPVRFCFSSDHCVCPSGQTSNTVQMDGRQMIFSFAAADRAPSAQVKAVKWDPTKYCRKKPPERGTHNGDPHLATFDGVAYDVSALGEFVVSRDPQGGFEVQARHEPIGLGGSGTSAVALSNGRHRVTFTASSLEGDAEITIRVDGTPTDLVRPSGPDGLTIAASNDQATWTVTWSDAGAVTLRWNRGWFATITTTPERAGRLVGLLGASDGDPRNDLLLPDGTRFDIALDDQARIDDDFARKWLVDGASTLFDYGPGQSPATFANAKLNGAAKPAPDKTVQQCRDALGSGATEHEVSACAYDVTVTGDESFVQSYVVEVSARVDVSDPLTEAGPSPRPDNGTTPVDAATGTPSLLLTGSLYDGLAPASGDAVAELAGSLDLRAGAVIIGKIGLCAADVDVVLRVTRRETGDRAETRLCDPFNFKGALAGEGDRVIAGEGYILIGADGSYDVSVTSDSDTPLYTEVQVFADAEPVVVDRGQALSDGWSGSLDTTGDAVVLPIVTGDKGATYSVSASDDICFLDLYGVDPPGDAAPWPIDFCGGGDTIAFGASFELVVPVVVFNRTGTPAAVRIERSD